MQLPEYLMQRTRCPYCVKASSGGTDRPVGVLRLEGNYWLVCISCERKYPLIDNLPVLMIEEGNRWTRTPVTELPIPPSLMQSTNDRN